MKKSQPITIAGTLEFPLTSAIFRIFPPELNDRAELVCYVESTLSAKETFDVCWARFMGIHLIEDMWLADDRDDGVCLYMFRFQ